MSFTEDFLNGLAQGQQLRQSKQAYDYNQRKMQYEAEDRDVEKQLLQHRLKELKLTERLNARKLAQENLQSLSGMSRDELTPDVMEGGVLPATTVDPATGMRQSLGRMKPITIPGVEGGLLDGVDIPDIQVRPKTMEDQLAELYAQTQAKTMATPYNLAPGGVRMVGNRVVAQAPPRQQYTWVTRRDKSGKTVRNYVPVEEALGRDFEQEPLPHVSNTFVLPGEDIDAIVDSFKAGRSGPADLAALDVKTRTKVSGALAKAGFDMTSLRRETDAMRAYYQTLNSGDRANLQTAANILEEALNGLEGAQKTWQSGGNGAFSSARVALAKTGALGADAKQAALDFEQAVTDTRTALAALKTGGSTANTNAINAAAAALSTGSDIPAAIRRLRKSAQYTIAGVRNLEAITPSSQAGDADFDYDPATGQLVSRKK